MHIQAGPATVLDQGTVTTFFNTGLSFQLAQGETPYTVELVFSEDESAPEVRVDSEALTSGLHLTLVNFNDVDGRGSAEPVLLFLTEEDAVFFHFRVFRYGASVERTVHYTFFRVAQAAIHLQHTPE